MIRLETNQRTGLILLFALAGFGAHGDTILSADFPGNDDTGCLIISGNQGYRAGWTQSDTYNGVSISAKLTSNGAANQTGRAYLTTDIGPDTSPAYQIASTAFTFPTAVTPVVLFQGLVLRPGSYFLSIVGDSPSWGSCWTASGTNVLTATGVSCLGGFGAPDTPSTYFPATPFFAELTIPPEFTVQGTKDNRPLLEITSNGNSVSVSWSTNAVGFKLESADSLASANWQTITEGLTTNSGRIVFTTNPISGRFFRLRKPAN